MRCGRPLLSEREEFCQECRKVMRRRDYNSQESFEENRILFVYQGPVKNTMYRFKYSNRREYAAFFGRMVERVHGRWIQEHGITCIVPVPMYPGKERKRGYNQASLLAREISKCTGIPAEFNLVTRSVNTAPLKLMDEDTRKKTLVKAFSVNRKKLEEHHYDRILVVDDIYTTGTTISAIAAALKRAGVLQVYGLTICGPKE